MKLAKYLAGELSADEKDQFLEEVRKDPELKHDVTKMKQTWKQFSSDPSGKYQDTEKAWGHLKEKIEAEGMDSRPVASRTLPLKHTIFRVAAMVALVLAVGIPTLYYTLAERDPAGKMISHEAVEGVLTVDLPDGSRVFLNEGANLGYRSSFTEEREVRLRGEGFFDVMSDPNKPFRVNAGKVIVTVLGTSFNVKEAGENKDVEVFVESGSVQLAMTGSNETVVLTTGELGRAADRLELQTQRDANYLSWKTRKFKFVDESVQEILGVLQRSYHVEVETNDLPLDKMRLTTAYDEQSFDAILETICTALNLYYEKEGKVYILHAN